MADFSTGTSRIDFASGPVGTASDFATAQTTSTDFASIQALAQTLLTGQLRFRGGRGRRLPVHDGRHRTAITDAVKLAGTGTAGSVKFTDVAHGALA